MRSRTAGHFENIKNEGEDLMMKYIRDLKEGSRVAGVYLCKHKQEAVTKKGNRIETVRRLWYNSGKF